MSDGTASYWQSMNCAIQLLPSIWAGMTSLIFMFGLSIK